MNAAEFARSIRRVWAYAEHIGVGELFSGPTALSASINFKRISTDPQATYEQIYLCGLRNSDYNILLKDFAYFQFGAPSQTELRFAYYPNPFLGASSEAISELNEQLEYVEEGIIEYDEYLHSISELRYSHHPPLVRYENDPRNYVELKHPCSHFHIGHHSGNRWPVRRVLNPAAFALLLLKLFYSDYWEEAEPMLIHDQNKSLDEILQSRRMECHRLPDEFFSNVEQTHFAFD